MKSSVFADDEVLTATILDRLLHHGTVINIRGRSCQLHDKLQAGTIAVSPVSEGAISTEKRGQ
ncbi:MAG TPA: ATP-binding protein [Dehalococcoidia bacterium]|nr:ATP-binding protein [Dehalococcoidia bacterium]